MYKLQGATHKGLVRDHNEDRFVCNMLSESFGYALVCDGIGGSEGGSQSSTAACEEIRRTLETSHREDLDERSIYLIMETALEAANSAVFGLAQQQDLQGKMGTTVCLAVLSGKTCYLAHAGDSRVYLFRGDSLTQLTVDHSRVQALVSEGKITADEAKNHPDRHYLTNAVGVYERLRPSFGQLELEHGDLLLLCSDGLYGMVEQPELVSLLHRVAGGEDCQILIDAANEHGGMDNITAVAVICAGEEA